MIYTVKPTHQVTISDLNEYTPLDATFETKLAAARKNIDGTLTLCLINERSIGGQEVRNGRVHLIGQDGSDFGYVIGINELSGPEWNPTDELPAEADTNRDGIVSDTERSIWYYLNPVNWFK